MVASDGSQLFYTSGRDQTGQLCDPGPTSDGSGQVRLRLVPGAPPAVRIECLAPPPDLYEPRLMLASDFDADGFTDLAMFDGGSELSRDLRVVFGAFTPSGLSTAVTFVPQALPSTVRAAASTDDYDLHARMVAAPHGFVARVEDAATGRGLLVAARCDPATRAWQTSAPYDPVPGGHALRGFAPYTAIGSPTTYVGWNGVDGTLTAFDVDLATSSFAFTSSAAVTPAPLPNAVRCATFPDVNADGAPDLVTDLGDVVWGNGAYGAGAVAGEPRFGSRIHYRTLPAFSTGDGLLVLREDGAQPPGWTIAQELNGGAGSPIGIGPLELGAPPAVITFVFDSGEIVVVESDGNGSLR